jgi:hypothetical protein
MAESHVTIRRMVHPRIQPPWRQAIDRSVSSYAARRPPHGTHRRKETKLVYQTGAQDELETYSILFMHTASRRSVTTEGGVFPL